MYDMILKYEYWNEVLIVGTELETLMKKEILQRYLILDVVKETTNRTKVLLFELGLF